MRRSLEPAPPNTASILRRELIARNLKRCASFEHELSSAELPNVLYTDAEGTHGNFYPPAYRRILANPAWRERLRKAYTASRTSTAAPAANSTPPAPPTLCS